MGTQATWDFIVQTYQHIRLLILSRLSFWNMGGIITIGAVAYQTAGLGFWEFVFFLGVISVNLAVINFLPIPPLDGGQMVFLLIEKVRGRPVPENAHFLGMLLGFAFVVLLILAVSVNDVWSYFRPGN